MMKTPIAFFSLILLLTANFLQAQIDLKTYTSATDTFYWKRYVHILEPKKLNPGKFAQAGQGKVVELFMTSQRSAYPQFTNDSLPGYSPKTWKKYIFPTDIDGDGVADIIFNGPTGGKTEMVRIYLNRGDTFELVFEDYQYFTKFIKENKRLSALQTGDVGSGDSYLWFTRSYVVNWENGNPVFIRGKQVLSYKYNEEPREFYPVPVPFVSKADTMLLRASAAQLNEPFNPYLDTFGNIIAKYRSSSRGTILASKSYGKGNIWYYVEVAPGVYPTASILSDFEKIPTFIRGWVSCMSIKPD
jgi:hypothetical protein